MSNYNSFIIPSNNNKKNECLEQYYRYIVGMSMNQQHNNNNNNNDKTASSIVNAIIQKQNQNDLNHYQKVYVDTLVDITTLTIRTSWPMEITTTKEGQPVVNTHAFVRHLLKRSRATRSTLQLAIFYLFRVRAQLNHQYDAIVKCGRRMFLAALICAHKFLYDNTFTNASWAKISKLPVKEINQVEKALLEMLDYRLFVSTELYEKFEAQLKEAIPATAVPSVAMMNKKRTFDDDQQQQQQQQQQQDTNTTLRPIKKPRQHHLVHGIPTPEDDKVELLDFKI